MALRKKKPAATVPQNSSGTIMGELKFVTEEDATAQFPDEATMSPGWSLRVNPRHALWLDPGDGVEVQYVRFAPWSETVAGKKIEYIVVVKAVATDSGARRVGRKEGRTLSFSIALGFLEYPDFVNTGKDNYIFPVRCLRHPAYGNVLAINITNYGTKRVEQRPVKVDESTPPSGEPVNKGKRGTAKGKAKSRGKTQNESETKSEAKTETKTEAKTDNQAGTPPSAAASKEDADK